MYQNVMRFCVQHPKKELEIICLDCGTIVCLLCFIESHPSHNYTDVDGCKKQISTDTEKVSEYSKQNLKKKEKLEKKKLDILKKMENVEKDIKRCEVLKKMVEEQTKSLLEELIGIKEKRLKEMETEKEEMDKHLVIMESFKMYCNELKSKGSPFDICRTVNDLHFRADELKKLHESQMQIELPLFEIHFEKIEILEKNPSTINDNNIVGKIISGNSKPPPMYDTRYLASSIMMDHGLQPVPQGYDQYAPKPTFFQPPAVMNPAQHQQIQQQQQQMQPQQYTNPPMMQPQQYMMQPQQYMHPPMMQPQQWS